MKAICFLLVVISVLTCGIVNVSADAVQADYNGTTTLWWFHGQKAKTEVSSNLDFGWVAALGGLQAAKIGSASLTVVAGPKISLANAKTTPTHLIFKSVVFGHAGGVNVLVIQSYELGQNDQPDAMYSLIDVSHGSIGLRLEKFQTAPFKVPAVVGPVVRYKSLTVFWGIDLLSCPQKTLKISIKLY